MMKMNNFPQITLSEAETIVKYFDRCWKDGHSRIRRINPNFLFEFRWKEVYEDVILTINFILKNEKKIDIMHCKNFRNVIIEGNELILYSADPEIQSSIIFKIIK
jgi:hypothetical protein